MTNRARALADVFFSVLSVSLLVVALAGCRRRATDPAGPAAEPFPDDPSASKGSLAHGGRTRTFDLHVGPARDAARGVGAGGDRGRALVLALHGGGGTGAGMERLTKGEWDHLADREGFVVAYPDGLGKSWGDGRPDAPRRRGLEDVDDVAFLVALVDKLVAEHGVDPKRVFATGISNGAMMSYRLACDRPDRFAAIAPVVGSMSPSLATACASGPPVPVLAINGTSDPLVPWDGGDVHFGARTLGRIVAPRDALAAWAKRNGCGAIPEKLDLADADPNDGATITVERYRQCRAPTRLYVVKDGGHTWPGGTQYAPKALVGRVCRDLDATEEIWRFFAEDGRRGD